MSTQAFAQYQSLENYLETCFLISCSEREIELSTDFVRIDVNNFDKRQET